MMRLTVQQLLSALFGLGSLTLILVGWDAERLIGAVDDLRAAQAQDHIQIQINQGDIADLKPRVGSLETTVQEQEHRIIRLEPRP